MKTSYIVQSIYQDFGSIYRAATPFIGSGPLWDFCIQAISDPVTMSCIAFANDLEIPPVKSLVLLYRRTMNPAPGFSFTEEERKSMGALMGFVFKSVLGYTDQKERCAVNDLGVKTATRFLNGPVHQFS